MSIRITIAKWLAPELGCEIKRMMGLMMAQNQTVSIIKAEAKSKEHSFNEAHRSICRTVLKRGDALREIAKLRTPSCAHGVKKACDIAEAALNEPR